MPCYDMRTLALNAFLAPFQESVDHDNEPQRLQIVRQRIKLTVVDFEWSIGGVRVRSELLAFFAEPTNHVKLMLERHRIKLVHGQADKQRDTTI